MDLGNGKVSFFLLTYTHIHPNIAFFGSFLYKSNHKNQLQVYPWTSANDFMIFSNHDFIAIGGG
jgi:hypothetical protein